MNESANTTPRAHVATRGDQRYMIRTALEAMLMTAVSGSSPGGRNSPTMSKMRIVPTTARTAIRSIVLSFSPLPSRVTSKRSPVARLEAILQYLLFASYINDRSRRSDQPDPKKTYTFTSRVVLLFSDVL